MSPCGPTPPLLARYGREIGLEYAERRHEDSGYRFRWPNREGIALYDVVRGALAAMTNDHCAYCDGFPIDAVGCEQVDHFKPKSNPAFYELVCEWTNLYLSCTACNKAKRELYEAALLRPDEPGFTFERYFTYNALNGELAPNAATSAEDQQRARTTLEILALNRAGACVARRRAVERIARATSNEELLDVAYRYLIPLAFPG